MTEHEDHDGELVETVSAPADPLRMAFGAAIEVLMSMLGDCPARVIAVKELIRAEERTREALIRRILN